ncbi:efflux RND transporter periplasmic adaptor subunit [Methylopila capsulata]|uniref:efflux RND transporter periplasmic adaptor subunit n=1 Tax=Methylopila capsulata TaxID=61654 RepID=UPI001959645F|nr:efflux RND transporter periplasmic adaptor subunit [Methylopila capsulata]
MTIEQRASCARRGFSAAALGLVLALALSACDGEDASGRQAQPAQRPTVSVVVIDGRSVAVTAELPGRVSASLVSEVRPQVGGIIQTRLFKEGSEVKQGDPLYQIDPASYKASYDSAIAAQQKAEAAVPSAQAKVDRYQGLAKGSAVSKQDLDDAEAALAQAIADVASAKAEVDTARINLDYTTIRAPIGGRVDASSLTPGALVTASQDTALTTVRTLDPINVDVTQSSTNLLRFREAVKTGRLKFRGPDVAVKLHLENGSTYGQNGALQFAEANVDETTGTFTVRASFPNPDRLLLPGMYVRAVIEEGVAPNSVLVTQQAVGRNTKGEATVKVVGADSKIEERVIVVGRQIGNSWLVDQGLKAGDKVVVEGGQNVRAGQEVTAAEVSVDDATGDIRDAAHKD